MPGCRLNAIKLKIKPMKTFDHALLCVALALAFNPLGLAEMEEAEGQNGRYKKGTGDQLNGIYIFQLLNMVAGS